MASSKRTSACACVAIVAVACAMFAVRTGQARTQAGDPYEIVATRNVMVAARDGVTLATDVYAPGRGGGAATGRFPTILQRTPYNKERDAALAKYFVPRGYVVVLQDVRGRYASEGHWRPIRRPRRRRNRVDHRAALERWRYRHGGHVVCRRYATRTGHRQRARAEDDDPGGRDVEHRALRRAPQRCVRTALPELGLHVGNAAGGPNEMAAARRAASTPEAAPALADFGNRTRDYIFALPLRPGTTPLKFAPDYEQWLVEAMKHGDYDDFWKNAGSSVVDHLAEYKDVPVYHITGWYDSWGTQVANMNYVELKKAKKSLQRLIVGPWTHGGQTRNFAGDAEFTEDARSTSMPGACAGSIAG